MKRYKLIARLAADICMIFTIAFAPLWLVVIFAAAFAWLFAPYYEIVLWGVAFDSLYGSHSFYGAGLALVIFVIIELLKKKTRI
ncbi:MAG: hypothetical protein P4L61_00700 [Candidatus Pacebacteria bacterium]|nr:hypothetical protein [Candidatus Paceibacterota bacterium]